MEAAGRVQKQQAAQDLVHDELDVVVRQALRANDVVQVRVHERLQSQSRTHPRRRQAGDGTSRLSACGVNRVPPPLMWASEPARGRRPRRAPVAAEARSR